MLQMLKRGRRLLLLDDDTAMQKLMGTLLRRNGYRVDVVSSGKQAIEKLGTNEYDALLLDLMTPTEGGLTVIRHLQENEPEVLKRVILVTASPDSVLKNVSGSVAAVVRKPFAPDELTETVARIAKQ
ncbi:MAG: response regulator [Acidobacteriota bacterium]|nr:response regulator [Acidobacteriota bacterium]